MQIGTTPGDPEYFASREKNFDSALCDIKKKRKEEGEFLLEGYRGYWPTTGRAVTAQDRATSLKAKRGVDILDCLESLGQIHAKQRLSGSPFLRRERRMSYVGGMEMVEHSSADDSGNRG